MDLRVEACFCVTKANRVGFPLFFHNFGTDHIHDWFSSSPNFSPVIDLGCKMACNCGRFTTHAAVIFILPSSYMKTVVLSPNRTDGYINRCGFSVDAARR